MNKVEPKKAPVSSIHTKKQKITAPKSDEGENLENNTEN